ncbi:Pc22g05310 [Penicillium rubens Wisconsin 54-1255]|uniref:Large ribosomal subunit protein uL2m n=1 Tax=Penicillium rubens (strain ATCC 28089 / DSM 1075 / NRRL 1951 / Wisconsin 54-1255) TaxID=500485 RepID=B6HUE4_PENRW|nr:Pc22g05310 [Penicillium rubens Wisconsin 54-1255]
MLQPRIALRGIRLPFRCLPSLPSPVRGYSTIVNEIEKNKPKPTETPLNSFIDPNESFAPPPGRDSSGIQLRTYTPRTPGVRHLRRPVNDHLWKGRPIHKLTFPKRGHAKGGRNNSGRVTVRHHGGGAKRRIRTIDFLRMAPGPHKVERIEYDPGRTAHIALTVSKETGKLSYILAADGMRAGDVVQSYMSGIPEDLWKSMGSTVDPGVLAARTAWRGNCLPLHMVPVGTLIFNLGLRPGKGGQLCRSAGTYATVVAKGSDSRQQTVQDGQPEAEKKPMSQREQQKLDRLAQHITVRLSSGETRLIHKDCCATVGIASNPNYQYAQLGKAGRSRWLNIRPTVRGLAMNAMDHPHGGGRGKSKDQIWLQDPPEVEDQQGCCSSQTSQPRKAPSWIQLEMMLLCRSGHFALLCPRTICTSSPYTSSLMRRG